MGKYTELKRIFEENQDPENAVKMGKYMRNLFRNTYSETQETVQRFSERREKK